MVLYGLQTGDDADRRFAYGPAGGAPYVISQLTGNYDNTPSFLDAQHPVETKQDAEVAVWRGWRDLPPRWIRKSKWFGMTWRWA